MIEVSEGLTLKSPTIVTWLSGMTKEAVIEGKKSGFQSYELELAINNRQW